MRARTVERRVLGREVLGLTFWVDVLDTICLLG
jgi:hypothetical protein